MVVWCWAAKGGVGTSVVAAAMALRLATNGHETVLVDLDGDQAAILGLGVGDEPGPGVGDWAAAGDDVAPDALGRLLVDVAPGLRLLGRGSVELDDHHGDRVALAVDLLSHAAAVVVDTGSHGSAWLDRLAPSGRSVCVIRPCYLAVDRTRRAGCRIDHLVLVDEPGRALRPRDVESALGVAALERIRWDPGVARAVDAGLMVRVLPGPLRRLALPT